MSEDNGSLFGQTPTVWVVFPILFFLIVAAGLSLSIIRRRRRRAALYAHRHNQLNNPAPHNPNIWRGAHANAVRYVSQGMGPGWSAGQRSGAAAGGGGPGVHGYWARAPAQQVPEGLNEFGEAPPPYVGGKAAEEGTAGPPEYPAGPANTYAPPGRD